MTTLTSKILDFAAKNKQGYTLNIRTLKPITSGFVVSYKETQNSFKALDVQRVIEHALKHDGVVGGWFNTKNKKYYFDSNKIFDNLEEALNFGIANGQISIFDLDKGRPIWINK